MVVPSFIISNYASFWINLRSSSKRETDILEITTFCPHLICCSVQDLYLYKVILRGVFTSSISTRWQQRNLESENPEILCVNNSRWGAAQHYSVLLFCFYVNDWTFSGLKPSFLIQQHEGKKMLCWINCRLNLKCKSLRVYVCISGQVTAPSNRRILSNFQIWLNRSQSFPQNILWRSKRTTYRLPKARFSVNYFV